jgi:hypothetical protein
MSSHTYSCLSRHDSKHVQSQLKRYSIQTKKHNVVLTFPSRLYQTIDSKYRVSLCPELHYKNFANAHAVLRGYQFYHKSPSHAFHLVS